jgi:hypothetical protein
MCERTREEDYRYAHVAQEVEHFLGKEEVTGSNPVVGSSILIMKGPTRSSGPIGTKLPETERLR